jgi:hypothetical protein
MYDITYRLWSSTVAETFLFPNCGCANFDNFDPGNDRQAKICHQPGLVMDYRTFTGDDKGQIKSVSCELPGEAKTKEVRLSSTIVQTRAVDAEQNKQPIQRLRCHREPNSDTGTVSYHLVLFDCIGLMLILVVARDCSGRRADHDVFLHSQFH